MIPASQSLLVLRRERVDGCGGGLRAVLCGDLEGFEPIELVGYLAHTRWTGSVSMVRGLVEKRIFVRDGHVVWATSNLPADRLGQILRGLGLVTDEDLDRLLSEPQPEGTRLGQLLLASELINAVDLQEALRRQVEHIFFSVLLMEKGLFFVFNDPVEGQFAADLDLNYLLVEGLRRIDELHRLRHLVPNDEAWVIRRARDPSGLTDLQWRAWVAIDDGRTVAEVAEEAMLSEFDAVQAVYELVEAGYVRLTDERPAHVAPGPGRVSDEAWETVHAFNIILAEIYESVRAADLEDDYEDAVNGYLADGEHGYIELFRGMTLDEHGRFAAMDLVANLAAVEDPAAGEVTRYLWDAMNELMFFALLQAGRLLPAALHHALSRRAQLSYQILARELGTRRTPAEEPTRPRRPGPHLVLTS